MHAILYAAGRASRLGAVAATRNKVLLEFQGKSLLERHIMLLARVNVSTTCVVTGHRREQLRAAFPQLQSRYGVQIIELFNPDYAEGSILSMRASLSTLMNLDEPVLLMDGDVLYDGRMLQRLIHSPHPTSLLIDRDYSTVDDDPVLVPIRNGRPFEFLKRWTGQADAVGESIGLFKVHPTALPVLIRETDARVQGHRRSESYDEVIRAMVRAGLFDAEDVTGLPWIEIDYPHDLDDAAKFVVPALRDAR